MSPSNPIEILVVDDNPGDVRLIEEAMKDSQVPSRLHTAKDGEEAIAFLRREWPYASAPRPHIVLLDLNMPRVGGLEVLRTIKRAPELRMIPTVILTSSMADKDIQGCYAEHANAYLVKPTDLDSFSGLLRSVEAFWMTFATLPAC
ncbi:MAG: response regulator [Holophagaceae bacterium]